MLFDNALKIGKKQEGNSEWDIVKQKRRTGIGLREKERERIRI